MRKEYDPTQVLYAAIMKLLRPLVRLSLRRGIAYGAFASLLRWVYYDVAKNEFGIEGRKQTHSRISVITGLTRKEVKRLSELPPPDYRIQGDQYNRATRVIAGWRRDKDYVDKEGRPRAVPVSGQGATFEKLVKRFSGDMPTRAVLDELIRLGSIQREADNRVRLVQDAFTPAKDDSIKFHILGTDVALLISTIEHNIDAVDEEPFFQRKVYYDNLPQEELPEFKRISGLYAQKMLDDLDRYLSRCDRDVNPAKKGTGRYATGMGIYYFEKPFSEED